MPDVFISYARKDEQFVRRLHDAMTKRNQDVWVDWEDIPLTADWWHEIQTGIDAADTFIFVISPDSARSEVCYNEVDHAYKNNKRIVPIVYRDLSREDQQKMHPAINRHNWVFFNNDARFEENFERLDRALNTNLAYVREHTRLLVRAKEWDRNDRNNSFLLRGIDLSNAENLLMQSAQQSDPRPTDLQTAYVFTSRRVANQRQRLTLGSVVLGLVVAIGLAILALMSARQAEANLRLSQRTQSLFLADLSRQELEAEHYRLARLLALEAVQHYPTISNGESNRALLNAVTTPPQRLITLRHDVGPISGVKWNQNETQILSLAGQQVLVWDASSGDILLRLQHDDIVRGGIWNRDESRILTWSDDGTARVWDPFIENELFRLTHADAVTNAFWILNGTRIVTFSDDRTVRLWNTSSGAEIARLDHTGPVSGGVWHAETRRLAAWANNMISVWTLDETGNAAVQQIYMSHGDRINGLVWNGDGSQILSWSRDQTARIWDAATGQSLHILPHNNQVLGAAWNVSETWVLTWTRSPTAYIWNLAEDISCPLVHDGIVNGAVWDAAGERVLSWASDRTVRVWDDPCADSGEIVQRYERAVEGARWNEDETWILSWAADNTVRLWDTAGEQGMFEFVHDGPVTNADWNATELKVISTSLDNTVHLWSTVENDQRAAALNLNHGQRVNGAEWNEDETRVLSWSVDRTARVWDVTESNSEESRLLFAMQHDGVVNGATWNPDESLILTWSQDGTARIWNTNGSPVVTLQHEGEVVGAVWNEQILTWSRDGTARLWSAGGSPDAVMQHDYAVMGAALNPEQTRILTWTVDGVLRLWNADGNPIEGVWRHDRAVLGAMWNPDGSRFLSWSEDGTVRVWSAEDENPQLVLPHSAGVVGAAWNSSGTRILSWTRDNRDDRVYVWDAEQGDLLAELPHGTSSFGVQGAVWAKENQRILSWSSNGIVRVWDMNRIGARGDEASPQPVVTLRHERFVVGARWNEDETRILSWSTDDTARIWSVDGEELFVFRQDDALNGARWNEDETEVLTWNNTGLIKLWVVDVPNLIEIGRSQVVEPLSPQERAMFFLPVPTATPSAEASPPAN